MELKRAMEVVALRFDKWHPATSLFGENGFRVEIDNYNNTGRILVRGKVKFESLDAVERFKWDISGKYFDQDKNRIMEIQRVVAAALA